MSDTIRITAQIERKSDDLPVYVVIEPAVLAAWDVTATLIVEGLINSTPLGRRSLKPWRKQGWFIELPKAVCAKARVAVGDTVQLQLRKASTENPIELQHLLDSDLAARQRWLQLTASRRRLIREYVLDAVQSETRAKRAAAMLSSECKKTVDAEQASASETPTDNTSRLLSK